MPRSRAKKVGLKRIDAAIDALGQLGFGRDVVVSTVNELLKVYGGDEAWPFIEEGAYRILVEKILEGAEQNLGEDVSSADVVPALKGPSVSTEPRADPARAVSPPPRPRRLPCYGWISESESDSDSDLEEKVTGQDMRIIGCQERKRKSAWN